MQGVRITSFLEYFAYILIGCSLRIQTVPSAHKFSLMNLTTMKVPFLGSIFLACLFNERIYIKIKIKENCCYGHVKILPHTKENLK